MLSNDYNAIKEQKRQIIEQIDRLEVARKDCITAIDGCNFIGEDPSLYIRDLKEIEHLLKVNRYNLGFIIVREAELVSNDDKVWQDRIIKLVG